MEVLAINAVRKIKIEEETFYTPVYVINGVDHVIQQQGYLVYFETEEEALEYFKD